MKFMISEIIEKMDNVSKPQKKFIKSLITTVFSMRGRVNFKNMSRYSQQNEKTFSRNFEKFFDYFKFNTTAINKVISKDGHLVLACDQVFIKKSGKKTYGLAKFWNGSQSKSEKGLEALGFALVDVKANIGYPLGACQTPPNNKTEKITKIENATRTTFYIHCIKEHTTQIKKYIPQVKHVVLDGYFSKEKVITKIIENDFDIVGKLRSDANLRSVEFEQTDGPGRKKKYGEKINIKNINNFKLINTIDKKVKLYSIIVYSINFKRKIRVIALLNKNKTIKLLFSTDLNLDDIEIYNIYKSRFQIEFIFRDAKQHTGLNDFQARSKKK